MGRSEKSSPAPPCWQARNQRLIEEGRDYVTHHLRQMLDEPEGNPAGKKIARILRDMALKGNLQAIREVLDRADGKPAISIGGVSGEPLEFAGDMPMTLKEIDEKLFELLKRACERDGFRLARASIKKPRADKYLKQSDS